MEASGQGGVYWRRYGLSLLLLTIVLPETFDRVFVEEVTLTSVLGCQALADLFQFSVNIVRRLCDEVRERGSDLLLVIDRDDYLKGIGKDEMENGFALHAIPIAAFGKQATSESDIIQKIIELPGVVE